MCIYCNMGDSIFRFDPPWNPKKWPEDVPPSPFIPPAVTPVSDKVWPIEKLKEYLDILERIKALEDKIGCPCDPNKADYIGLFKKRIAELEKKIANRQRAVRHRKGRKGVLTTR